ncbi:MAG: NAD(+) diphosphatase [Gammaproteobacteria bacterium]|nr:NAD(+) diphosphatase [Gammaproteobacteria bacterium]
MTDRFDDYSNANVFVDYEFDRHAHQRSNPKWLERTLKKSDTRFIVIWRHRCAVTSRSLQFARADELQPADLGSPVFLGMHNQAAVFAIDLGAARAVPTAYQGWDFQGLRSIGTHLCASEAALAAFALAMVLWIRRHRFCGLCGTATTTAAAGHVLHCSNPECGERSFPRSDPAIIVLATDNERVLLGRQASWPEGRYSTIAGFVEPGESLEAAVRREVAEETGHLVSAVEYVSSQPWPFPSSLMLGFTAQVSGTAQHPTDEELEDVRWFTLDQIVTRTLNGPALLPPPMSIAYRLIERWFDQLYDEPLAQIIARRRG